MRNNLYVGFKGWLSDAQAMRLWSVLRASLGRLGRLYEIFLGRPWGVTWTSEASLGRLGHP